MKKLFSLAFGLLLVASEVHAASYRADSDNLLRIQISEMAPTRITFDGQKIVDVFFYPEEAAKVVLHNSGSVFVVPNKEQKHVYVTVMSDNDLVQDLRLKFGLMQPVPIRLVSNRQINPNKDEVKNEDKSKKRT